MSTRRLSLPAIALLVGLGAIVAAAPAFAQPVPPGPPPAGPQAPGPGPHGPWQPHHWNAERFLPGRIAFFRAELKITPQQEPQWNKVAEAMRLNAREIDAARAEFRGPPKDAVQALEARSRLTATLAKNNERLLAAFRPLYRRFSPDQKKMADTLMTRFHHRRFD